MSCDEALLKQWLHREALDPELTLRVGGDTLAPLCKEWSHAGGGLPWEGILLLLKQPATRDTVHEGATSTLMGGATSFSWTGNLDTASDPQKAPTS